VKKKESKIKINWMTIDAERNKILFTP